jgi:transglutaminase-like putative cysteine protease
MPGREQVLSYPVAEGLRTLNEYITLIHGYVVEGIGSPEVIDAARKVTAKCQPYDSGCETAKVYEFIRKRFRYVAAPSRYGIEVMQTPQKLIGDIENYGRATGECEEMITLLASMLGAINHEVALVYGGEKVGDQDNYRHVWAADNLPEKGGWVHLDPTGYLDPGLHFKFETYGWDFFK